MIPPILLGLAAFFIFNVVEDSPSKSPDNSFFKYDNLFKKWAKIYNIPWYWLKAISMQESDLGRDPRVLQGMTSRDGKSFGIMQIAEGLGSPTEIQLKGFGGKEKLNDPNYSIMIAAKLLNHLKDVFNNDETKVFLAYNQGEMNTLRGKNFTHPDGRYAEIIKDNIERIKEVQVL